MRWERHTANQYRNPTTVAAEEFLFISRKESFGIEFRASFRIRRVEFRRRHFSPAQSSLDKVRPVVIHHTEKDFIGFSNEAVLHDDDSDDVRFDKSFESIFTRAQRFFNAMARCD